ncbi:T9SS C-terminal target domain-containing protein [Chitinophaga lutea]|uniref:T9SS C-terminal target domain-containing protein n=1 Tax=Chitinophaga lutea TaxID=2488634 RepID=A0A3N4PWM0_9BACT|nr:M56 family metallopeptidase [Chitinophaga lutea]RPE09501.1 T9SS C-terminal target domain-containing protein [Chitinophaga lutea]
MPELIIYLIKANIALCLFYLAYRLGLRRLTFYTLNRFFLVSGIIFSSLFPLVDVNDFFNRNEALAQQVITYVPDLNALQAVQPETFTAWMLLEWVFWAGVGVMFLRLLVQLASLLILHRKTAPGTVLHREVRVMGKTMNPFSFFRNIYVNPSLHTDKELKAILDHESVHVRDWHSADVMLSEMNNVFYWFNPGAWLMKTAVKENLEFLTDRTILRSGMDPKAYQYSLIQVNASPYTAALANNFNFSHLKNRISMMNKRKSSAVHIYRYAVLACLVCGVLLSLNFTKPGTVVNNVVTEVKTAITGSGAAVNEVVSGVVDDVKTAITGEKRDTAPEVKKDLGQVKIVKDSASFLTLAKVVEKRSEGDDARRVVRLRSGATTMTGDSITVHGNSGSLVAGKVMGVRIRSTSSDTTAPSGNLRLHSVPADKQPLYVLDGEIVEWGIEKIDPAKIEAITVLKDKPATALYGSAGNNGVILITTKAGLATKTVEGKGASAGTANGRGAVEEVVVTGYAKPRSAVNGNGRVEEVVVTGYGKPRSATNGKDSSRKEVTVTGYGKPKNMTTYTMQATVVVDSVKALSSTSGSGTTLAAAPASAETIPAAAYPNPTTGLVNIAFSVAKAGKGHLEVIDMEGGQVYYKSLNGFSGNYKGVVDLKNKPAGTYILKLVLDGRVRMTSKIVKQ